MFIGALCQLQKAKMNIRFFRFNTMLSRRNLAFAVSAISSNLAFALLYKNLTCLFHPIILYNGFCDKKNNGIFPLWQVLILANYYKFLLYI